MINLKQMYRKKQRKLTRKKQKLHNQKTKIAEWLSIFKKHKLYKNIKLTKVQKKEIDNLWKETPIKKVSYRWHRLYMSINDTFDKYYVPDYVFSTYIEPRLNPIELVEYYQNKAIYDLLYSGIENLNIPKTYVLNVNGKFQDSEREFISFDKACEIISELNEFVIKPIVGTSSGEGVKIVTGNNYSKYEIKEILNEYSENYIIQEKVVQHEEISKLHPNSLNTFRVITYQVKNKICVGPIVLRIGINDSFVDNSHAGGLTIGVSNDGYLKKYAYQLGWVNSSTKYTKHPNTNIVFEKYKISNLDKVIEVAIELHKKSFGIGIISWDLTINTKGEVVLIEGNYLGQSIWLGQITHGKGFFNKEFFNILKE